MLYNRLLSIGIMGTTDFRKVFIWLVPIFLGVLVFWANQSSSTEEASFFFLKCPFYFLTEWLCPTCGMTRSIISLLRGEWLMSWEYHPLGGLLFISLVLYWGLFIAGYNLKNEKAFFTTKGFWLKPSVKYFLMIYIIWGFGRNFHF